MTKIDQNKILENKIKANTFDFNLNRQSAIVSALADGNFDKYEYLTRIDLALKPNSLQKARFEHSPLGNLLSKKLIVSGDSNNVGDKKDDGKINDGDDNISDNKSDVQNLNDLTDQLSVDDIFYSPRSELSPKSLSVSPEQMVVDNIDNELSGDNKSDNKSDAQDLIDQYEPDEEYLAKLDKLLNCLKDDEEFLKDFKTNMDNIDNEQANKRQARKAKSN